MISELEYRMGRSCHWKIQHLRAGLPHEVKNDSAALWLRSESGKVKALAESLFPHTVRMEGTLDERCRSTRDHMDSGRTIAAAAFATDTVSCSVDFVTHDAHTIRLHTVTTKNIPLDPETRRMTFLTTTGRLRRDWRETIEMMSLRVCIVQQLWPNHRVLPFLVAPISGAQATIEGFHGKLEQTATGWIAPAAVAHEAATLLRAFPVLEYCQPLLTAVPRMVEVLDSTADAPPAPKLAYRCKNCEFRGHSPDGGYERCWGELAGITPSMWDLAYMYFIQDECGRPIADALLDQRKASMFDIPVERITGEHAARQLLQLEGTRSQREIIDPAIAERLCVSPFPHLFLDIETLRSVIPPHRGMRVNSLTLFQFSVHIRRTPDGPLEHVEWLNTEPENPNHRFLSALRNAIGDHGTIFTWTKYESDSFKTLLADLITDGFASDDMRWLKTLLRGDRVVDLHELCRSYYWHPKMAGRTSIKAVLPAVWLEDSPVKSMAPYRDFPAAPDPYEWLKSQEFVADGARAMGAYLDVLVGVGGAERELLRYCFVDTLAMCFVADYWLWRCSQSAADSSAEDSSATDSSDRSRTAEHVSAFDRRTVPDSFVVKT